MPRNSAASDDLVCAISHHKMLDIVIHGQLMLAEKLFDL
ncbi:Uncharacterised protein [Vibrio cholerae]|nr:Uncharacterised protein [Vibrio cholerae]